MHLYTVLMYLVIPADIIRLAVPFHLPCISEGDFNIPLPSADTSSNLLVDPVHYHIAMCRIAKVFHRFKVAQQRGTMSIIDIVEFADNELVKIMRNLPPHLHPDEVATDETELRNKTCPWIQWQRYGLKLVILHNRLIINRELQKMWLRAETDTRLNSQRAICLSSASSIIWISKQSERPIERRPQW